MSLHRHCDVCEAHMKITPTETTPGTTELQLVRGKRQGFLGPIPNVLDLCRHCKQSLKEWIEGRSPA